MYVEKEDSRWSRVESLCCVVLRDVFSMLEARDLARAGAVCRVWRCAANDQQLWRRLVIRDNNKHTQIHHNYNVPDIFGDSTWRDKYVLCHAPWVMTSHTECDARPTHAALSHAGDALAVVHEDVSVSVWVCARGVWQRSWGECLRVHGWSAALRVQWATRALLLTGARALDAHSYVLVMRVRADYACDGVSCSARTHAACCWCDTVRHTFVTLDTRTLTPTQACTTVWLNAATQGTHSEYAPVRTQLLTVYNEDNAPLTHVAVSGGEPRVLVAGGACVLRAWYVRARLEPVKARAAGELAERVRVMRERRAHTAPGDAPAPSESEVRAVCAAPDYTQRLPAPLVGLALHNGRWACAACSDGTVSVLCARTLRVSCVWRAGDAPVSAHFVQPDVCDLYAVSGGGARGVCVCAWSVRIACGMCVCVSRDSPHCAVLVCNTACAQHSLITLAGHYIEVWRSRATRQPLV